MKDIKLPESLDINTASHQNALETKEVFVCAGIISIVMSCAEAKDFAYKTAGLPPQTISEIPETPSA